MQNNEWTAEQRFGSMVLSSRQAHGMSQKDVSSLLSKAGLALDTSAVSRIEKGTRALRLSEAIAIARELGFSLADFEDAVPPVDDFRRREERVDNALNAAHSSLILAADELNGLTFVAELYPEVLASLPSPDPVTDARGLLRWKVLEWEGNLMHNALGAQFESEEIRDGVRDVLFTVTASAVDSYVGPIDNR
jgi:transcriptional regulator with XRE-family HTH domain